MLDKLDFDPKLRLALLSLLGRRWVKLAPDAVYLIIGFLTVASSPRDPEWVLLVTMAWFLDVKFLPAVGTFFTSTSLLCV